MNRKRIKSGFTLAELLIVIAIVMALAAVAFISVPRYLRSMSQLEYDTAAKEIFVAAQNHLTLAHSQGYPGLTQPTNADEESDTDLKNGFGFCDKTDKDRHDPGDYYFMVSVPVGGAASTVQPSQAFDILNLMLPPGAIDRTISSGNYIIRYNRRAGVVKDVFYSGAIDHSGFKLSNRFASEFEKSDYEALVPEYCGDKHSSGYKNKVIGWYGGAMAENLGRINIAAPTLEIINAERLIARVTNNGIVPETEGGTVSFDGLKIRLTVTGKLSSGEPRSFVAAEGSTEGAGAQLLRVGYKDGKPVYEIVLDSVTESGKHFAQQFTDFYPGEDIEIEATCFSTQDLAPVMTSGKRTTNSLFGDGTEITQSKNAEGELQKTGPITSAKIANFRHLENMDPDISGISTSDTDKVWLEKADQTQEMIWKNTTDDTSLDLKTFKAALKATSLQIYDSTGTPACEVETYYPIDPVRAIGYDGHGYNIIGTVIDVSDKSGDEANAGLFRTLTAGKYSDNEDKVIENLVLVDFDVKGGNAGALAGNTATAGATISNVLVRNTRHTGAKNDAGLEINGSTSAGGLIGSMTGGSVEKCAAAVYVKSTSTTASTGAGGLIGSMDGTKLTNSYSGGHTLKGQYALDDEGKPVTSGAGRVNVTSTGNAGGLIGYIGNTVSANSSVENCYSTCSVSGKAAAGGLIGKSFAKSINNCYCTGLVVGDAELDKLDGNGSIETTGKKHAFIGINNYETTVANCYYFSIINDNYYMDQNAKITDKTTQKTTPTELLSGCASGVTAFDSDAATYNTFCIGSYDTSSTANSQPYDAQLTAQYAGKYFIQTIAELADLKDPSDSTKALTGAGHLTAHFGDWPEPEILILNTK